MTFVIKKLTLHAANHLDLPSILWLTHHFTTLADPDQTIVIVSHDKEFLNNVTEETIVFKGEFRSDSCWPI
jgi:ATPase subunit of ABC transporter with duplicated ATPase domains